MTDWDLFSPGAWEVEKIFWRYIKIMRGLDKGEWK